MSAKSSLPILGATPVSTLSRPKSSTAVSSAAAVWTSWLWRTLKISRMSTSIVAPKAAAIPAASSRTRVWASLRMPSSKLRIVPARCAVSGMTL